MSPMRTLRFGLPALLVGALAACALSDAAPFTKEELESVYYYDLGPAEVDVSGYPKEQQENYETFKSVCSRCHTLARAVNSPTVDGKIWTYYLFRMSLRKAFSPAAGYSKKEEARILDFLVYDSKVRKVERKAEFEAVQRRLETRFDQTIAERMRRLQKQPANRRAGP